MRGIGKKVLITGASGFVGKHLVSELLKEGFVIVGLDRTNSNDNGMLENANYFFEKIDLTSASLLKKVFVKYEIDLVIHLAAHISFIETLSEYKKLFRINVEGTKNLICQMINTNIKNLIFVSSMAVIGRPKYLPVDEKHPCEPINFYGLTKKQAEDTIIFFSKKNLLKGVIFRFPGIFSEKRFSGALYNFIRNSAKNEELRIDLSREIIWDVIHVSDVVASIVKGVYSIDALEGAEIFHVDYGEPIEIEEIAKRIIKMTESGSKVVREGNSRSYPFYFDTYKARNTFNLDIPSFNKRLEQFMSLITGQ